jgi:L-serine dehydratase
MAPVKAAEIFKKRVLSDKSLIQIELLGSLALTGKGHLTDKALLRCLGVKNTEVIFNKSPLKLKHPNTMIFREISDDMKVLQEWKVFSVGGGELLDESGAIYNVTKNGDIYDFDTFDGLKRRCSKHKIDICGLIEATEEKDFFQYLSEVWSVMKCSIKRGLDSKEAFLPGELKLRRKAGDCYAFANKVVGFQRDIALIGAYALAVAEENACGNTIVTAPTCGSAGVLLSVLFYYYQNLNCGEEEILRAMAVAGMIGLIVEKNASISGAEIGCQGEIGTACAMAAAAAAKLQQGEINQIEYSAEIAIEHFLGLTCDPVLGLVQIPCIERNAFAAMRALECSIYALSTKLRHKISLDEIIKVMYNTGIDMGDVYKETSLGGLAGLYKVK